MLCEAVCESVLVANRCSVVDHKFSLLCLYSFLSGSLYSGGVLSGNDANEIGISYCGLYNRGARGSSVITSAHFSAHFSASFLPLWLPSLSMWPSRVKFPALSWKALDGSLML